MEQSPIINPQNLLINQHFNPEEPVIPHKKQIQQYINHQQQPLQQQINANNQIEQNQSQDQIIQDIVKLGEQIFQGNGYYSVKQLLEVPSILLIPNKSEEQKQRKYSYTDRLHNSCNNVDIMGQQARKKINDDDWISCENYQQENVSEMQQKIINQKIPNKMLKKQVIKPIQNKYLKNKNVQNNSKERINFKKHKNTQRNISNTNILNTNNLQQPNYLKSIGNHKQQLLIQLAYKQQMERIHLQNSHISKSSNRLQQLYKQKLPLYEKYLQGSHLKQIKTAVSRIQQKQKQTEGVTGKPQINTNIKVNGSFQERRNVKQIQKNNNKIKIIGEQMENCTFKPKLNQQQKKYKNVTSKIKNIWSNKNEEKNRNNFFYDHQNKEISEEFLKTDNFFTEEQNKSSGNYIKNKSFDVKVKNFNQLSYILELEDFIQD